MYCTVDTASCFTRAKKSTLPSRRCEQDAMGLNQWLMSQKCVVLHTHRTSSCISAKLRAIGRSSVMRHSHKGGIAATVLVWTTAGPLISWSTLMTSYWVRPKLRLLHCDLAVIWRVGSEERRGRNSRERWCRDSRANGQRTKWGPKGSWSVDHASSRVACIVVSILSSEAPVRGHDAIGNAPMTHVSLVEMRPWVVCQALKSKIDRQTLPSVATIPVPDGLTPGEVKFSLEWMYERFHSYPIGRSS